MLTKPFPLGGIGSGVIVTHRGRLGFLPDRLSLCYYSKDAKSNLVSLGRLHSLACRWQKVGIDHSTLHDSDGSLLDTAPMIENYLTPVTALRLASGRLPVVAFLAPAPSADVAVPLLPLYPSLELADVIAMFTSIGDEPFHPDLCLFTHVFKEQRDRCERVEMLHHLTHASDDALCQALDGGAYQWANVTATDVRLNRKLRGLCVACVEGKFHNKSFPSSESPPATAVGQLISFDTQELLVKSVGGNQCYIDSIDEFSGDVQVTPAKSLKAVDLFNALMVLVHRRYSAHGHVVTHMMADSLPALEPVIPMLGAFGILLTLAPPGQHAHRVERSIQGLAGRRRALLASLPFVLPTKYLLYCYNWVAETSNGLSNYHSRPSCADIIVTGARRTPHYEYPGLGFGSCCMVSVFEQKRRKEASLVGMFVKDVHRAELGVCMGYSRDCPGTYDFLLAGDIIVTRAVIERVNVTPFDCTVRKVLVPILTPPSVGPFDVNQFQFAVQPSSLPVSHSMDSAVYDPVDPVEPIQLIIPSLQIPSSVPSDRVQPRAEPVSIPTDVFASVPVPPPSIVPVVQFESLPPPCASDLPIVPPVVDAPTGRGHTVRRRNFKYPVANVVHPFAYLTATSSYISDSAVSYTHLTLPTTPYV